MIRPIIVLSISLVILFSSCQPNEIADVPTPKGGYAYQHASASDSIIYFYPIRDSISPRDSFNLAMFTQLLFRAYNEPNISLASSKSPVYRFVFSTGFTSYTAILTLKDGKMIVKELVTGHALPYTDTDLLDPTEARHLELLFIYFPINRQELKSNKNGYLDSLCRIYPELLEGHYYRRLKDKAGAYDSVPFTYQTREISLTKKKYNYFINLINQSGYWEMKPVYEPCAGYTMHPNAWILEAATPDRYQFVDYLVCANDSTALSDAIEEMFIFSKMKEKHKEWEIRWLKERGNYYPN